MYENSRKQQAWLRPKGAANKQNVKLFLFINIQKEFSVFSFDPQGRTIQQSKAEFNRKRY